MSQNVILPPSHYIQNVPVRRTARTSQKLPNQMQFAQNKFPIPNNISTNQFPLIKNIPQNQMSKNFSQNQMPKNVPVNINNNQTYSQPKTMFNNNPVQFSPQKQAFSPPRSSPTPYIPQVFKKLPIQQMLSANIQQQAQPLRSTPALFMPQVLQKLPIQQMLSSHIQQQFSPQIPTFRMSELKQNNQPQKIRIYDQQNNPIDLNINITLSKDGKVIGANMISQQQNSHSIRSSHISRSSKHSNIIEPVFDYNVEEEVINCVICNENFLVCQTQKHLAKHQRTKKSQSQHKILHKSTFFKKKQQGPIIKPIVQPQEYNLQYEPNSFILSKDVVYMSRQQPVQMKDISFQDQQIQMSQHSHKPSNKHVQFQDAPLHQSKYRLSQQPSQAQIFNKQSTNRQSEVPSPNRVSQEKPILSQQTPYSSYMHSGSNFPPCDQIHQDEKQANESCQDCINLSSQKQDMQQHVEGQNIFMKRNLKKYAQPIASISQSNGLQSQKLLENSFKKKNESEYSYCVRQSKQQQKNSSGRRSSQFSFNDKYGNEKNNIQNQSHQLPNIQELPEQLKPIKSQQKKSSLQSYNQSQVQLPIIQESPVRKSKNNSQNLQRETYKELDPLEQCASQEKSSINNSYKQIQKQPSRLTGRETVLNPFRMTDTFTQIQEQPKNFKGKTADNEQQKQGTQYSEIISPQVRRSQQFVGFNNFIQAQIEPIKNRQSNDQSNRNSSIEGNSIKQYQQLPYRNTVLAPGAKKKKIAKNAALAWF